MRVPRPRRLPVSCVLTSTGRKDHSRDCSLEGEASLGGVTYISGRLSDVGCRLVVERMRWGLRSSFARPSRKGVEHRSGSAPMLGFSIWPESDQFSSRDLKLFVTSCHAIRACRMIRHQLSPPPGEPRKTIACSIVFSQSLFKPSPGSYRPPLGAASV